MLVDGASVGALTSYSFTNVTAAHTIAATFTAKTYAITASAGANGSISPSGSVSVSNGASQAFTITPNTGYQVQDVLVDGASVGALTSYSFTNVTAAHTIAATFTAKTHAITASAGANGSISPSGSVSVTDGGSKTFTITANTGYQVKDVLVDGASVGALTSYSFTNVTAAHTIAATFTAKTYAITASAGANGSISPSGSVSVTQGANQAFTITANTGYQIQDVKVDGNSVGAVSSYSFSNVTAAHTIAATFIAKTYTITASSGANGTISPLSASVSHNVSQAFTITPNTGYQVKDVLVDGASVGALTSYSFSNVTAAHTIAATFTAKTYAITASAGTNGSISPSGSVSVTDGGSKTFTITANTGYQVKDVLVDGASVGAVASYSFSNVTAAHTITASFAANTHKITISAGAHGKISPTESVDVETGYSLTFLITPDAGYRIKDVLVDGVSVGAISSYTFLSITSSHTLSASFEEIPLSISASAGQGGTITPSGNTEVLKDSTQSFAITPNTGYSVKDVLVDGVSVGPVYQYIFPNITISHSISASFTPGIIIRSSSNAGGKITPEGSISINQGSNISFSLTPSANYLIRDVQVDGVSVGSLNSYTFSKVTSGHSISAVFGSTLLEYPDKNIYSINASDGVNGTISPSGSISVLQGGSMVITITPNSGYKVQDVLVDGASVGAVTSYTFTNVTSAHTISASFAIISNSFLISASAGSGGSISPSGNVQVQKGASQSFTIKPNRFYKVADLIVDGTSVGAVTSYTFSNIQTNHTISATFIKTSKTRSKNNQWLGEVSSYLLAGSGAIPGSGGWIEVLNPLGEEAALPVHIDWPEYNKLSGEMRVATGDIDGDGRDEIIVGLGPVKGVSGIPGGYFAVLDDDFSVIAWGQVEWPEYNATNGETRPACGDIDGDGIDEIIIGLGPGGEGRLEVFKLDGHQLKHVKWLQTGWQDYNRGNGETRPACGDLDGNGTDEVIVGLGPVKGNPEIPGGVFFIFDHTSAGSTDLRDSIQSDASGWGVISWPDYNRINGESWPTCGDVNGDGRDEIVLGLGKQGAGRFEILGFDLQQKLTQHITWQQSLLSVGAEVRPACGRLGADAGDEIVIGFSKAGIGFAEVFGNASQNFQPIGKVQTQSKASQKLENQLWPAVFRLINQ